MEKMCQGNALNLEYGAHVRGFKPREAIFYSVIIQPLVFPACQFGDNGFDNPFMLFVHLAFRHAIDAGMHFGLEIASMHVADDDRSRLPAQ